MVILLSLAILNYVLEIGKAELVQVNHTPIICLRNFIHKKSEIVKTKTTFIIGISFKICILGRPRYHGCTSEALKMFPY